MAIMTGTMIPKGTNRVVPIELCKIQSAETEGQSSRVIIPLSSVKPDNPDYILKQGSVIRKGSTPLKPCMITAKEIGLLGALGYGVVPVRRQPKIAIITTGSELIQPGNPLPNGCIYDSNGNQLLAQTRQILPSADITLYQPVQDSKQAITTLISQTLEQCNILILNGGVSMGEFDYVPQALQECGVKQEFHRVAIKPGKPVWFGTRESSETTGTLGRKQYVFGLPGNPLSALVGFNLLITPLIRAIQNLEPLTKALCLPLATPIRRTDTKREEFIPVKIEQGMVIPVKSLGSADLSTLAELEGFIPMPIGVSELSKGEIVHVRLL